jgi:FAD/FMN-containing dehydrogenase
MTMHTLTDGGRHYRAAPARVEQPANEDELRRILAEARREQAKVIVRGAGKSQGGLFLDDGAIVIDTARLNRVLAIDVGARTARVQAGVTWDELRRAVNPHRLSPASNQSYGVFSVGGSVSVNAHGRNVDTGVLAATILSLRVMLADGTLVEASRTQHAQLFRLVIGGFGLFGIVVDVTLQLVPNDRYVRGCVAAMPSEEYPRYFASRVRADPDVHFHYARFDVYEGRLWQRLFCVDFRREADDGRALPGDAVREHDDVWFQRATLWCFRKFRWARRLRFWGDVLYRVRTERTRRNNVARESWKAIERHARGNADWLQEFFIPVGNFTAFVAKAQRIFGAERFRPLNTTVRYLPPNTEAFLSYARTECFSFVLFFEQQLDAAKIARTETVMRRLLDAALECGGTYYLCYHRFATSEQLRRAYPEIDEFFTLKRRYDPQERFINQFYRHYAAPATAARGIAAMRPLRLPTPERHRFTTADDTELLLERYRGGDRGPLILAPGYSMSNQVYTLDSVDTNLAEYLCQRGYDVWLFSWRSCPELAAARTRFTLDDVARYDWPAALDVVQRETGASQVDAVVHCIGSQTMLMSIAAGHLENRVRSAVCLQVGLYYDQRPLARFKAAVRTAEALDLVGLRYLSQSARAGGVAYKLLDGALKFYPVAAAQRCDNVTCRRSTFIWGELVNHANISEATHARMTDFLGDASIHAITQMTRSIRRRKILDAGGHDVYFGALERLRLPITFIHGAENLTMGAGSTARTFDELRDANGAALYRRHSIPGYGHMDCIVGRDAARDVFPHIGEHLERVHAASVPAGRAPIEATER